MVAMDGHSGPKEINVQPEFLDWLTDPVQNGAGALFDFGCYGANLMTWLMDNQRPIAVTAVTQHFQPDVYPRVDDEATILVEYPKAQGIIQASWNWPFNRKDLEVYGDHGLRDRDRRHRPARRAAEGAGARGHARPAARRRARLDLAPDRGRARQAQAERAVVAREQPDRRPRSSRRRASRRRRMPGRAATQVSGSNLAAYRGGSKTGGASGIAAPSWRGSEPRSARRCRRSSPPGRSRTCRCAAAPFAPRGRAPPARLARGLRHQRLDVDVAAAERSLREAARLERLLDVEAVVGDVGDELRVRLRLVEAAHDAEADLHVALLHERRDDRVQRPLARRERVRVAVFEREQRAAVVQHEAGARRDERRCRSAE